MLNKALVYGYAGNRIARIAGQLLVLPGICSLVAQQILLDLREFILPTSAALLCSAWSRAIVFFLLMFGDHFLT
jgi:hypothetical protein